MVVVIPTWIVYSHFFFCNLYSQAYAPTSGHTTAALAEFFLCDHFWRSNFTEIPGKIRPPAKIAKDFNARRSRR